MLEEVRLRLALWWRSRSAAVTAHLARRSYARPPFSPAVGVIRVAAVQMRPRLLKDARQFADHAYELAHTAVQQGAELVVFPDHVTLPLLRLVPGLSAALDDNVSLDEALVAIGEAASGDVALGIADIMTVATPAFRRLYGATFSTLARRFGVHIAAGGTMLAERDGRVLSIAHLYGPNGRLVLHQAKTHLSPLERRWGLGVGEDIQVADTALGRVALTGSMESAYFEPYRLLERGSTDLALLSAAELGRPQPWRPLRGAWARVQEARLYGIQGALVGEAFGLSFAGPAAIYAPLPLTPARDGILAMAQGEEDEVVVADLDIGALRRLRAERPSMRNEALIGHYLPLLYTRPWPWPEDATGEERRHPWAGAEAADADAEAAAALGTAADAAARADLEEADEGDPARLPSQLTPT